MGELLEALKGITIPESAKSVVVEADRLFSKRHEDASYLEHLESKIKELQTQTENLRSEKGISGAQDGLTFDARTGTWKDAANLRYCARCLSGGKRSPMRDNPYGWQCPVCGSSKSDPDRPAPTVHTRGPRGGWLG